MAEADPEFGLDPAGQVTWSEGTVRGPRQLPMLLGERPEVFARGYRRCTVTNHDGFET